ncbi:nickel pincer cofactor biosynthesis protein LarC [Natronoglomus mannanivorans]|uniref:Putative nickel insertion protein n=1 Tax=Natronoglomus mannanivorans TaxID=2979990 RepID=A0AAP3E0S7_9EURY|nr:nickel pincer cofactor biosynthesis protein LarC [Halobacteria archaeon AArc-xg1-1]
MRLLAFDGHTGASGDMILGALLAAGADPSVLAPVEDALECEYAIDSTTKCAITATAVDVLLTGSENEDDGTGIDEGDEEGRDGSEDGHRHGHDHGHSHDDHGHSHDGHGHSHDGHVHAEGHGPHRSYREVVELVEELDLEPDVERDALAIFELLGEAEAAVHGTDLEETHFHEVGADDAIADIVGATLLLADLEPDRIVTTPLSTGGGTVSMSHGEYPVPTPAVVELAERADWSFRGGPDGIERELLTPTGAAILAHFATGVESVPALDLEESGYGAGGYDFEDRPNVLRVLVGTHSDDSIGRASDSHVDTGQLVRDDITVLETNLDDATPEVLGGLQDTLADAGARDVSIVPVTMKKSRPGHLVKVLCKPADSQRVARRLAEETGTLGIRETGATHRWIATREFETVTLEVADETYEVDVKIASDSEGDVYDVSAEYDDALAVATATGRSVRSVIRQAEVAAEDGR